MPSIRSVLYSENMSRGLSSDQKGSVAESAIPLAAIRLGIEVYRPLFEGGRSDLVFGVGRRLLRVQCKWAHARDGVLAVRCYSSRRAREGIRKKRYNGREVDLIAVYCPDLERCFAIPAARFDGHVQIQLRIQPCRNNQQSGVTWADDYALESLQSARTLGP